jgi:hypothetical protein
MVVNDYAGLLTHRGVFKSLASKLAPTEAVIITAAFIDLNV